MAGEKVKIRIINKSKHPLPEYKTLGSSGVDVRANLDEPVLLRPFERALIPTGIYVEIPEGYEIQVRPRSGMALKKGITLLNTPGTIDSDYRGEIKIIVINLSQEEQVIEDGERIAQLVLCSVARIEWVPVEELADSDRGEGGFGHTGFK